MLNLCFLRSDDQLLTIKLKRMLTLINLHCIFRVLRIEKRNLLIILGWYRIKYFERKLCCPYFHFRNYFIYFEFFRFRNYYFFYFQLFFFYFAASLIFFSSSASSSISDSSIFCFLFIFLFPFYFS